MTLQLRPTLALALALAVLAYAPARAQSFNKMAQPADVEEKCEAPRPPSDLDSFAYVRNGYREILRITAIQSAIDNNDCKCPFDEIEWAPVVQIADDYRTSDNPKLPFDVIELRSRADALAAELNAACGN